MRDINATAAVYNIYTSCVYSVAPESIQHTHTLLPIYIELYTIQHKFFSLSLLYYYYLIFFLCGLAAVLVASAHVHVHAGVMRSSHRPYMDMYIHRKAYIKSCIIHIVQRAALILCEHCDVFYLIFFPSLFSFNPLITCGKMYKGNICNIQSVCSEY
jgi:hypothetical protein